MSETYYRINEEAFTTISRDRTRLLIMEGVFVPVEPGRLIDRDQVDRKRLRGVLARAEANRSFGRKHGIPPSPTILELVDIVLDAVFGKEGDDEH